MSAEAMTIAEALRTARSRSALIEAAQRIQHVQNITDRDRLCAIVKRRLAEFKAK